MDDRHAEDFARMAMEMRAEPTPEQTIDRVVAYAQDSVACDYAGVMVVRHQQIETAATTDPIVEKADQLQMECGEGPCLESVWRHDSFVIDDSATDRRWPAWGPRVAALGLRSMLSVRLFEPGHTLGALNLYARQTGAFDPMDVSIAHILARHASVALANSQAETTLARAVDARHLIGQAQGILMERFDLDADQAFGVLRRYSQDKNVKLRDVARRLVDTRRLPDRKG